MFCQHESGCGERVEAGTIFSGDPASTIDVGTRFCELHAIGERACQAIVSGYKSTLQLQAEEAAKGMATEAEKNFFDLLCGAMPTDPCTAHDVEECPLCTDLYDDD